MKIQFKSKAFGLLILCAALVSACGGAAFAQGPYHVAMQWKIGGDTGWDYLAVDPESKLLYVTHGDHVVVIDTSSGKVKADISAREVVIMGDVCDNLNGGDRVEIRSDGSLTGNLAAHRICIEDGAFLKGAIDVLQASETDEAETLEEPLSALEPEEAAPTLESDLDRRTWESVAMPEID